MRRTLLAVLFFIGLVAIWTAIVRAKIWSPVLLPSPQSVWDYFVSAVKDGTLIAACAVTLRRLIIGYAIGLAIGLVIRYASRSEEKEYEVKTPLGRINWSFLSLPFLWPVLRGVKERFEDSADAVKQGVGRVKDIDLDRYTKPIRKRWKSWTN